MKDDKLYEIHSAPRVASERASWMIQRYCHFCAGKLRGLRMWCPDCRHSAISWVHVALVAALDAAVLVYLLRLF
jgi:uncharacterized OB-fold protein